MPKVFLSAGHGGSNPGAVANGLKEKDINLIIMLENKRVLERHGVEVVCSRLKDEEDDVYEEVREANASGADIAVSHHVNAFRDLDGDGSGDADGSETFYYAGDPNGKRLAELCEKHTKALGQNSRGVKSGNHLYFINQTNMTAVLTESFFLDNKTDKAIGDTIAEQKAFGVAYAKAILEYLGIPYKEESKGNDKAPAGKHWKIQLGAYDYRSGAEIMLKAVHDAGFKDAYIKLE